MKLDKRIVDRRVELLRREGIEFVTGAHVGANVDIHELQRNSDAIYASSASGQVRKFLRPSGSLGA